MSRQQGIPAVESLSADFPDEFRDNPFPESIFHVEDKGISKFQDIIMLRVVSVAYN